MFLYSLTLSRASGVQVTVRHAECKRLCAGAMHSFPDANVLRKSAG